MSKNISQLTRRKGIDQPLFERLVNEVGLQNQAERKQLAKDYLVGEAIVHGAASFYDFIEGDNANKKAYVCNGSACLCAGTQARVEQQLQQFYSADDIGHVTCLGRCHENAAFQINGENFSGNDIEHLTSLIETNESSKESYAVVSVCDEPILTAEIADVAQYYQSLVTMASEREPNEILQHIIDSGLRGRGGAGFPTGIKWQSCRDAISEEKYIVCNADEGDAGAYSDRYLLEQQPHAVMFGMWVAGYLTGATVGVLYIRDEYPAAIIAVEKAIQAFEQLALVINNKPFRFKVVRGAGAYICGEETALLRSIEGQRPVVSVRPPFPTQSGLFGCPTVVNNVETFASIHWILSKPATAYQTIGNGRSTGTKLVSLDSSFNQPGIYEVPMSMPLAKLVELAGGYARELKALHIGGPLGGVVPISKVKELTIDFESFAEHGFLLGHASIIGIPADFPMIDYIAHLFEFTAMESCGKCYPCRLGAAKGQSMVEQAIVKKAPLNQGLLKDLLETMKLGSLCALGGGVPLPIENIIEYFADELLPYWAEEVSHGA